MAAPRVPNGDYRDHDWMRLVTNALRDTPLPATLADAVNPLHAVLPPGAVNQLLNGQGGIERTRHAWRDGQPWGNNNSFFEAPQKLRRLGLVAPAYAPTDALAEDYALSMYSYSVENP